MSAEMRTIVTKTKEAIRDSKQMMNSREAQEDQKRLRFFANFIR